MGTRRDTARSIIDQFLERAGKARPDLTDATGLFGDGLELDSLEAAELSAMLEDELGSDPFSTGEELPETVGDVLGFYEVASNA